MLCSSVKTADDIENLINHLAVDPFNVTKASIVEVEACLSKMASYMPAYTLSCCRTKLATLKREVKEEAPKFIIGLKKRTAEGSRPNPALDPLTVNTNIIENRDSETIEIDQPFVSLTLKNLKNCTATCKPVKTSVYLDNCSNCTFHIGGQQIRANGLSNCRLHLFSPTGLTIEGSHGYTVFPQSYSEADLTESCLLGKENNWSDVKDFDTI